MQEKQVILIRKQSTPFTVNFPIDGRIKKYEWKGTQGKVLNKRPVPFEVYNWLALYTTTFNEGMLIIDKSDDEEINEIKENIENVDVVEKSILTKEDVEKMLNTGNHLALKKELNKIIDGLSDELIENQKRYIVTVASEIGLDSAAKRKVVAEWAGIDYENSDLIFDKTLKEIYDNESK